MTAHNVANVQAPRGTPGSVIVYFIDVGQGDATVVVDTDTRSALVVDCAGRGAGRVAELLVSHRANVDTMLVTHWDLDHYGGLTRLLRQVGCRRFLYNHDSLISQRDEERSKILATLRQILNTPPEDVELGPATSGVSGSLGQATWHLVAPSHRHLTEAVTAGDRNLASGVVRLQAHGKTFIVGGDADARVWESLSSRGYSLSANALRYPHHGSLGPSRGPRPIGPEDLLHQVSPDHTVFSVGTGNRYGHPLPEAIQATTSVGSRVLCTQVTERCHSNGLGPSEACAGDVTMHIDPSGLTVRPTIAAHGQVIDGWDHPMCR